MAEKIITPDQHEIEIKKAKIWTLPQIILTLVIILFLGIGGIRQKQKADHYKRSIEELSSEVKQIEDTNRALEEEKKETDTDAFKERVAREKLGLIKKDEYAIKESDEADSSKSSKSSGKKKSK